MRAALATAACKALPLGEDLLPRIGLNFYSQPLKTARERAAEREQNTFWLKSMHKKMTVTSMSSLLHMLLSNFMLRTLEMPGPKNRC